MSELTELLTPESLSLLDSLNPLDTRADVLQQVSSLRKAGHSASRVAAVLSQARLRQRAVSKFGEFASHMLFTEDGLEQSTRLSVAALHAARFQQAGCHNIADLGCGIGADALALAALGIRVTAVERDAVTAAIASYNLAAFPEATVINSDATQISLDAFDGVFLDPARRTERTGATEHGASVRLKNYEEYSPSLEFCFDLAERLPTGVKLGPGFDREHIPHDAEAQWISVGSDVVEMGLWFGALARPGIRRSALVISADGHHEIHAEGDSADVAPADLGRYLYEPDGAVIRARLIGDVARQHGLHMIDPHIAYMSGDEFVSTPFARGFEILEVTKLAPADINKSLAQHDFGQLEIKKRGVDLDPADFRKKLKFAGDSAGTLILTRLGDKRVAILARRM